MISALSRYAQAAMTTVESDQGRQPALYVGPVFFTGQRYDTIVIAAGDDFSMLAHRKYNDPGMWWRIADANPQVFYPEDFIPGYVLRVPQ